MQLKIVAASGQDAAIKMQALGAGVMDLTDFWFEKFGPRFCADIQENWDTQGSLVGGWPDTSPGYTAWKARRWGQHLGVLELSLRLRGSLQWVGAPFGVGPEGVFEARPRTLVIGTNVPYAAKHQYGQDGMLKREFLFFRDSADYDTLWTEWVSERAVAAGLHPE